ncbi:pyrroline-5-carboxylate reductase [Thiohalorhabdus methylotrophus]|uniref:Pyrroline-5-carboxylate reductase n=1 Tax=Thiohalorhabdus methylotrophus TaxID=3242694 RepID=A0ABV4TW16_9GAMM
MAAPTSIAFIGGGNMAASLIGGLSDAGWTPGQVMVAEPDAERRRDLSDRFGVRTTADNSEAVQGAETVVLAVKPQILGTVAEALGPDLRGQTPLVISIAAGIPLAKLRGWLGTDGPLVRVMPNTPALVGAGVSALYADDDVSEQHRLTAQAIMQAAGEVVWVAKEAHMDIVTAVSGSGPAYFFLILEALEEAAVAEGLDRETARTLAVHTAGGAAALARDTGEPSAVLRSRVTSPGGTTARGLEALERGGLRTALMDAVAAAANRSRELGS